MPKNAIRPVARQSAADDAPPDSGRRASAPPPPKSRPRARANKAVPVAPSRKARRSRAPADVATPPREERSVLLHDLESLTDRFGAAIGDKPMWIDALLVWNALRGGLALMRGGGSPAEAMRLLHFCCGVGATADRFLLPDVKRAPAHFAEARENLMDAAGALVNVVGDDVRAKDILDGAVALARCAAEEGAYREMAPRIRALAVVPEAAAAEQPAVDPLVRDCVYPDALAHLEAANCALLNVPGDERAQIIGVATRILVLCTISEPAYQAALPWLKSPLEESAPDNASPAASAAPSATAPDIVAASHNTEIDKIGKMSTAQLFAEAFGADGGDQVTGILDSVARQIMLAQVASETDSGCDEQIGMSLVECERRLRVAAELHTRMLNDARGAVDGKVNP